MATAFVRTSASLPRTRTTRARGPRQATDSRARLGPPRDIEASELLVRVGINTGQAGVGLVGAADPGSLALGDVTNVADRLPAVPDLGTIAVGDATARRVRAKARRLRNSSRRS
jgi:class 3 adenylate cyclase